MSNISDMWGGFIHIEVEPESVSITVVKREVGRYDRTISAEFDPAQTRKLITELKKALDEMEDKV